MSVGEWFGGFVAFGLRLVWLGLVAVVVKPGDTPAGVFLSFGKRKEPKKNVKTHLASGGAERQPDADVWANPVRRSREMIPRLGAAYLISQPHEVSYTDAQRTVDSQLFSKLQTSDGWDLFRDGRERQKIP